MPVTNYYTVDGQMIGYKDAGGRKDFLTDALGSVTAEVDQTGATKTFDGRYKPYGGDMSSSGTRGSYGWVGTWGYRETGLSAPTHYVRARHYSKTSGNWTTVDMQWPRQDAYGYGGGRLLNMIDFYGQRTCAPGCCSAEAIDDFLRSLQPNCKGGTWGPCPSAPDLKKDCQATVKAGTTSCREVRGWIDKALGNCLSGGFGGDKDAKLAGAVMCCQDLEGASKWKSCGAFCCSSGLSSNPCWNFCVVKHEQYHEKKCRDRLEGGPPGDPGEPCAYRIQAECMFEIFKGPCKLTWGEFDDYRFCKEKTPEC